MEREDGIKSLTTDVEGLQDGIYIVRVNGEKKMYHRKTTYKGMPQEKLKQSYEVYVEGSIETLSHNITADISSPEKFTKYLLTQTP